MWMLIKSSNERMNKFIGKKCECALRTRKDDGHLVLYVHEPGNVDNWYFCTSTVVSVSTTIDVEDELEKMVVSTRNSKYVFYKTHSYA
jgi:hypothetical protein